LTTARNLSLADSDGLVLSTMMLLPSLYALLAFEFIELLSVSLFNLMKSL